MRNILSALTVIFFLCTIAFAQNSSTVVQTDDNHVAGVTESGSNTSSNVQIRTDYTYYPDVHNEADVDQARAGNSSIIYQHKGTCGGNTLHLDQANGASATLMQDGITNTSIIVRN